MDESALVISGLVKVFGTRAVVDDLNLTVERGSFFGLVGPNGSGKTTTLRTCVGLIRPEAGSITVFGVDALADPVAARAHMGIVPDPLLLFERLSGREQLTHIGLLRGLDRATIDSRVAELFDALGLTESADLRISGYSHGMRKKVALAQALLARPPLLLLDEPFEAVDPVSVVAMRELLAAYRSGGGTVIFSSHVMEVVEKICDVVGVLSHGRLLAAGPTAALAEPDGLEAFFLRTVGVRSHDASVAWLSDATGSESESMSGGHTEPSGPVR